MKHKKAKSQLWQQIGLSLLCLVLAVTFCAMLFVTIFVERALGEIIIENTTQGSDPSATIGTLLSSGQASMTTAPHAMFWPSLFFALLMISFNLFGNGLRDAFNPSTRGAED